MDLGKIEKQPTTPIVSLDSKSHHLNQSQSDEVKNPVFCL